MPAIDFPAAPAVNDEYSFEGRTWRWNGTGWEVKEYPAALLAGTAANPSLYFSGDPNTGLYSPGADQVAISTGGSPKLAVIANGNVGIGTLTPAFELHFGPAASASTAGRIGFGDISATPVCMIEGFRDSGSFAGSLRFHTTTGPGVNTERLRITSAGNVGIGTSAPGSAVDVISASAQLHAGPSASHGLIVSCTDTTFGRSAVVDNAGFAAGINLYVNNNGEYAGFHIATTGVQSIRSTRSATPFDFRSAGDITLSSANTERARIDSSGRLLVGTSTARSVATISSGLQIESSSYQLASQSITNIEASALGPYLMFGKARSTGAGVVSSGDELGSIFFAGADGTDLNSIGARINANVDGTPGADDMPGRLVFLTTSDGLVQPAERMRLNSQGELLIGTTTRTANGGVLQISNGITFPGTQSACSDANTLDDYEEGTFTPTVAGSSTEGTATYATQFARYSKIGRVVHFELYVNWSAGTGTGNLTIKGLPFTSSNSQTYPAAAISYIDNVALSANNYAYAQVDNNANIIRLKQSPTGGGAGADVAYDAAAGLSVSGFYTV